MLIYFHSAILELSKLYSSYGLVRVYIRRLIWFTTYKYCKHRIVVNLGNCLVHLERSCTLTFRVVIDYSHYIGHYVNDVGQGELILNAINIEPLFANNKNILLNRFELISILYKSLFIDFLRRFNYFKM